jgi:hypothetical protein
MGQSASQQPVTQDAPDGYHEIGETLAQPVAEGYQTMGWATELAGMLGYSAEKVRAWVRHYEQQHAKELEKFAAKAKRKRRLIEKKQKRSQELIKGLGDDT